MTSQLRPVGVHVVSVSGALIRTSLFPSDACRDKFKIYFGINVVLNILIGNFEINQPEWLDK